MKKEFEFQIDYYKPSGKWYSDERFKMEVAPCGPKHHEIPYNPRAVFDMTFGPGRQDLPGLCGTTWEGYAVLAHIETFRDDEGAKVTERRLSYLMDWSNIYEWHDRALALPGAPDTWLQAAEGKGLVKVDGDEGLYGISPDGAWWEPTGRADRPWVLAVDHPATGGVLLELLLCVGWWVATTVRQDGIHIVRAGRWGHARVEGEGPTLGRAAIATGTALGKWPGGGE